MFCLLEYKSSSRFLDAFNFNSTGLPKIMERLIQLWAEREALYRIYLKYENKILSFLVQNVFRRALNSFEKYENDIIVVQFGYSL